jgi:Fe-S cluster assembly protein SufD
VIRVAAGETIARLVVQDADIDDVAVKDFVVILERDARATFHILNTGGKLGRVAIDVTCHEGSHFELGGAIIGGGEQTLEIVTTLNHVEPNATSNQVVRSVLGGRATGSYLGKVAVARGAQKTDASQSVKAMLLTRTATANAKPELEIFADDVKCAHGATVGQLDADQLFYLRSRGLRDQAARNLLTYAFGAAVIERIPVKSMVQRLERVVMAQTGASA